MDRSGPPSSPPLTTDGPELHREPRELARDMHSDAAGGFQLSPELVRLIELEIRKARVIGNLPWRDRKGYGRNTGQLQRHEVANLFDRPDLQLRREAAP